MIDYAYDLNDQSWPPTLFQVLGRNETKGTLALIPAVNPWRVITRPKADVWIVASLPPTTTH